jgi:hypothetical protein
MSGMQIEVVYLLFSTVWDKYNVDLYARARNEISGMLLWAR